jgi:glycosyltransferase involved in cell wall biosynthesis
MQIVVSKEPLNPNLASHGTEQPLVSVGIAAYGRPDGLRRTLQCLSDQTYINLEIIVSDDCSPGDEISRVANQAMATDQRIRFYRQAHNIGAVGNYEFLARKATGKYFFWADDEDLCEREFVAKIVSHMESDPDLVLCACDVKIVDQHDHLIRVSQLSAIRPSADWSRSKCLFFRYPTSNIFLCILGIFKMGALAKANVRHNIGWKGYLTNGEVPFLAEIATLGRIVAIPEVLKTYRINQGSIYHSEIASIPKLDLLMLRLTIRLRLCKIALVSEGAILGKVPLIYAIVVSFVASNVNSLRGWLSRMKRSAGSILRCSS